MRGGWRVLAWRLFFRRRRGLSGRDRFFFPAGRGRRVQSDEDRSYNAYVMEKVEPSARATVASLVSMSWNFGWAFSPTISGWLQVHYGFGPPFMGTITLYTVSVLLYWAFFWRRRPRRIPLPMPGD